MLDIPTLTLIKENIGRKIIYLNINGNDFVFRVLGQKEYEQAKNIACDENNLEDIVCNLTIVYPENFKFTSEVDAGYSHICFNEITAVSMVDDLDSIMENLQAKREEQNSHINVCINVIKAAFPEYTIDEIMEWDWDRINEYTMRAQQIIRIRLTPNIEIRDIRNENQEEPVNDEEFNKQLIENGICPSAYYFTSPSNNVVNNPIIVGTNWNNMEVVGCAKREFNK